MLRNTRVTRVLRKFSVPPEDGGLPLIVLLGSKWHLVPRLNVPSFKLGNIEPEFPREPGKDVNLNLFQNPFISVSVRRYTCSVDNIDDFVHETYHETQIRGRRSRFRPYQSSDFIRAAAKCCDIALEQHMWQI